MMHITPSRLAGAGILTLLLFYPLLPGVESALFAATGLSIGGQMTIIFIFAVLALGLNVVVGSAGLLHLGIAAFFGVGAYVAGVLTVKSYPFQVSFPVALVAATLGAGILGLALGAPTLRLRGDYLALVTLGFGEVVRFAIRNLEEITAGTKGLNPVPPPWASPLWHQDYRMFYYLTLGVLVLVIVALVWIERSRLGRAWAAVREDEIAASSLGVNTARVKLLAFAVGAALAGLAGCLYATRLTTTAGPDAYDFNRSVIVLCCVLLGGLGSIRGVLLGVFLLLGFDNVIAPMLDGLMQRHFGAANNPLLTFSNWRLCIFGLALILVMRFRPGGLLPAVSAERTATTDTSKVISPVCYSPGSWRPTLAPTTGGK